MYPNSDVGKEGKLRLPYECNSIAFIAEQASEKASDGYERIMDIQPSEIHQRVPFFCGSTKMVEEVESFIQGQKKIKRMFS